MIATWHWAEREIEEKNGWGDTLDRANNSFGRTEKKTISLAALKSSQKSPEWTRKENETQLQEFPSRKFHQN